MSHPHQYTFIFVYADSEIAAYRASQQRLPPESIGEAFEEGHRRPRPARDKNFNPSSQGDYTRNRREGNFLHPGNV